MKYWKFQFSDTDLINKSNSKGAKIDVNNLKLQAFVEIAKCCKPIPGDEITGCQLKNGRIRIHKSNCPNLLGTQSNSCLKTIPAQWTPRQMISQLKRIELHGSDEVGIANKITSIISSELELNIKSIHFDTQKNNFYGLIDFYVANNNIPMELIKKIKMVMGVLDVKLVNINKKPIKNELI